MKKFLEYCNEKNLNQKLLEVAVTSQESWDEFINQSQVLFDEMFISADTETQKIMLEAGFGQWIGQQAANVGNFVSNIGKGFQQGRQQGYAGTPTDFIATLQADFDKVSNFINSTPNLQPIKAVWDQGRDRMLRTLMRAAQSTVATARPATRRPPVAQPVQAAPAAGNSAWNAGMQNMQTQNMQTQNAPPGIS